MNSFSLAKKIFQRPVSTLQVVPSRPLKKAGTGLARTYADWRVGATRAEKRAHKATDSVLFTFDDYGSKEQVETVLSILSINNVKAAFFIQGDWAIKQPELVDSIRQDGHIIGNHTYSHQDLLSLTDDEVHREIADGPKSKWLRPPRGRYDARVRAIAKEYGQNICYWSLDSDDWKTPDPSAIARKVLSGLHPGAVILFHLHSDATIAVLPELISAIRARGLTITSSDEPDWGASS